MHAHLYSSDHAKGHAQFTVAQPNTHIYTCTQFTHVAVYMYAHACKYMFTHDLRVHSALLPLPPCWRPKHQGPIGEQQELGHSQAHRKGLTAGVCVARRVSVSQTRASRVKPVSASGSECGDFGFFSWAPLIHRRKSGHCFNKVAGGGAGAARESFFIGGKAQHRTRKLWLGGASHRLMRRCKVSCVQNPHSGLVAIDVLPYSPPGCRPAPPSLALRTWGFCAQKCLHFN